MITPFQLGDFQVGGPDLVVIAGPCVAESREICLRVAAHMKMVCDDLGFKYVFKASYDKANRTSIRSERGFGIEEGLRMIEEAGQSVNAPTTTDIHLPEQAAVAAKVIDLLQIPAFLCRQTDLLQAAAATGRAVNVKKGQFLAPPDTRNIIEKLNAFHARGILLTERGACFGYNTLIVDMPGLEVMRSFGVPVCFDATHSAQRPGSGTVTGGVRESIPAMARAATAVGIDALFLEVHPNPEAALSDAATQWPLDRARELLTSIKRIHDARSFDVG